MTDKTNSRFNDNNTFAPRVVTKGDGKNPLDAVDAKDSDAKETEKDS